jgi:hypothetical protein
VTDSFLIRDVFGIPEDLSAVREVDRLIHEKQDVAEQIADSQATSLEVGTHVPTTPRFMSDHVVAKFKLGKRKILFADLIGKDCTDHVGLRPWFGYRAWGPRRKIQP